MRFSGKNIVITGGTSGMGLAGALRVVAEGGRVALTGLNPARLAAAAEQLPADSLVLSNDAASEADIEALGAALASWGRIDGLWLNAGYAQVGTLESVDAAAFNQMMNANVRGPMLQLARLSPMLNAGASVVVTSSSSTYEGAPTTSLYAATKGAVVAMARSWAAEMAERGVRVNVLIPGPIETNFRHFMPEASRRQFEDFVVGQVPLKRAGTADEAAAVALFLLSDDASYVTGSQYAVDGGLVRY
ncbi:Levodione reductase [Serratia rubidaea]|uniref:SDR family oxidoreductase n=2 Tax=Serratia rubidaea TaxID=61652 RepID=UPI00078AF4C8|nr:SDR family oxidoreductase [Serratia rubidaea]AML57549.1 3-oxoacyl-[acyl-carrier protein] reductase [Serratia rubidaea]MCR1000227.1 SDR family oxidoreductase [Serratia rubidaea]MDC6109867.1 SDR family oxidoreductase [Serratia rubidaea]CAI0693648.1 Levodione reductase [Serratia rubidaea]CAI1509502.1 Levodione reductase [Serratia rubidaea]